MKTFIVKTTILLVFLFVISLLWADDYSNSGFRKNVPETMKKVFPICDEFLDIKWIDKGKNIGKLKAEMFYGQQMPVELKEERLLTDENYKEQKYFLVIARKWKMDKQFKTKDNHITFEISLDKYNSEEFEEFIRKGAFWASNEYIHFGDRPLHPWYHEGKSDMISFAFFTKNICLVYPDEDAVLIIEDKKPFHNDNLKPELKQKYDALMSFAKERCNEIMKEHPGSKCDLSPVRYGTLLDVNYDGKEDYYFWWSWSVLLPKTGKAQAAKTQTTIESYIYFLNNERPRFVRIPNKECLDGAMFSDISIYHLYLYSNAKEKSIFSNECNLTGLKEGDN